MSKMSELDFEIREALDNHTGPESYLSCVDIAKMLGVPVEMVHQIVEERWDVIVKSNGVEA